MNNQMNLKPQNASMRGWLLRATTVLCCILGVAGSLTASTALKAGGAAPVDEATVATQATNITISGTVYDTDGFPIIGATVLLVEDSSKGASTNLDGEFTIANVPANGTIRISYVGMQTQTVAINGQTTFEIILHPDSELLEEVVVTGYGGTQQRAKVTNSIAKVDEKLLSVGTYSNPAQALAGAVPGLKVTTNSGRPGAVPNIVLRGGTNFDGSGSPLVLVDGQIRGGLNDINPEDIASIEVLKDAGATALYGARASNGVLLVTTKSGKYGTRAINIKATVGLNYINNPYDFLGAKDYITLMRRAYDITPWAPKNNLTSSTPLGTDNRYDQNMIWNIMGKTDENAWLLNEGWEEMDDPIDPTKKIIFKETIPMDYNIVDPAITQDYNINMSGANDKGSYYAGLGYNHSQGVPISTYYKRLTFLFNAGYQVADFIKSNTSFNYNRANWLDMPPTQGNEGNYFGRIMSLPPTIRFVDEEGNPVIGPSSSDGNQSYQPDRFHRDYQTDKFTIIQTLDIDILKNLSLRLTGNIYYDEGYNEAFNRDYQTNSTKWVRTRNSSARYSRDLSQTYNAVLNYNQAFDKHSLSALLGSEFYDNYSRGFSAAGSEAPTDDFMDLGLTSKEEGKREIDSWHSRMRILSFFGRVNYDYMDRYLLSLVARYDGYSSLLGENRWGFFPGLSGGWIFSEEDFMDDFNWLTFGKLRTSYGINGNASGIGAYTLQGSYNAQKYAGMTGYLIGNLPNPALRWEKTRTFEVGLDLGFLNNKISTIFTFYDRLTSDKYADLSLPSTTGFSSVRSNNGEFQNRGFEFEIRANIMDVDDFRWDVSANIAYNKNKVISLPDNGIERNRQGGQEIYTGRKIMVDGQEVDEKIFVGGYQEGQEPGVMTGYVSQGIFQNDEEINAAYSQGVVETGNIQGKFQYTPAAWANLTDAERQTGLLITPGDIKWKDINGDGKIDQYDQVVLGNTTPRWYGGANTTLSYKGLTFYVRVDYSLDFVRRDGTMNWFMGAMQGTYNTVRESLTDSWTPENRNAKYPIYVYADQLGKANYYRASDLFVTRGDYISLREVALSYSLPKAWCEAIKAQAVQFSITGQNLGYLTAGKVANPESAYSGSGYALPRTVLFGFGITF